MRLVRYIIWKSSGTTGEPGVYGERFRGTISEIRNSPTTIQNVVTYEAVIGVDNSELKLKPGMTANVSVIVARKDDAMLVPNAALRFTPPDPVGATIRGRLCISASAIAASRAFCLSRPSA